MENTDPELPQAAPRSTYAWDLAMRQAGKADPPDELIDEFDRLLKQAQVLYSRSSEMQIRDAFLAVHELRVYARPDIDVLKAARMVVDLAPAELVGVSAVIDTQQGSLEMGDKERMTHTEQRGAIMAERISLDNLPVSRAVEAIQENIVGTYYANLRAQYTAQQMREAAAAAQMERNRIQAQQRAAAQQAAAAAQAEARNKAIMEQEAAKQRNSPYGQLRDRGRY